jgi:pyruvate,water dikinase
LVGLDEIGTRDRARVGGKAFHLAQLAGRDLPVPPAAVVPVEVYQTALRDAGLWHLAEQVHREPVAEALDDLRARLSSLPLPGRLHDALVRRARALGGRVAVRSSAADEDGRDRSFAGQHLTVLDVAADLVPEAVRQVWASLYGAAAMAYRGAQGPAPGALAVVLQRMVEPRVSGVLFTVNPLSGSWREMTVEATWGYAEGLVSGQVTPHWYLVRRPRRAPRPVQRVLNRVQLHLVQQDLPEIREQWTADGRGGLARRTTPSTLKYRPTLDRRTLLRLCRLGLKAEGVLGEPQDVEWAIDYSGRLLVLQARPITTTGTPRARKDVLWTRRFIGERWPEPATPLGWSLLAPVFEYFVAYPHTQSRYLGGGPALRLMRSRPYVNVSAFRHLAFKMPGAPAPRFMLELIPPREEWEWQRRFAVLPDISVYWSFLRETARERRWQRFRWNPLTNDRHWETFRERLEVELVTLSRLPVSPGDAVRLVRSQRDLVREYIGIHICSLLFANLFYQLLEAALANWASERAASLMRRLAVCPSGNRTLETNEALWELAGVATESELEVLERGELPSSHSRFGAALDEFLHRYGHRSHASWEIMASRWVQAPERLSAFLRSYQAADAEEPEARARRQGQDYREALAELREVVSGPHGVIIEVLLHYTRRYLLLRENQRFAFDRLLFAMQRNLLWMGTEFVTEGWLERAEDIAYLTWDEVVGLATQSLSPEPVGDWIARRRQKREEDAQAEPPDFLHGDEGVTEAASGARLQGLGISPGRYRGRVRLIRSLAEGQRLEQGDVLVTRAVDPGWTPLLLTAGAVILEMGSRLSHGAVVAREYKVPAVVNIEGVARRLSDGQEVTVDGTRGVVWVHP